MFQSLVIPEKFQHILRIMNTNIDGKRKVMFAMTAIKGVGRRYSNIVLKKADIDLDKRAGECTEEEVCWLDFRILRTSRFFLQKIVVILLSILVVVNILNTKNNIVYITKIWWHKLPTYCFIGFW